MSWRSRPRWTKHDTGQAQTIQELRQLGMIVWNLADHGGEVLDAIGFWRGAIRVIEFKRTGHEDDFTENETRSIEQLRNVGIEPIIATCAEDIIDQWTS